MKKYILPLLIVLADCAALCVVIYFELIKNVFGRGGLAAFAVVFAAAFAVVVKRYPKSFAAGFAAMGVGLCAGAFVLKKIFDINFTNEQLMNILGCQGDAAQKAFGLCASYFFKCTALALLMYAAKTCIMKGRKEHTD